MVHSFLNQPLLESSSFSLSLLTFLSNISIHTFQNIKPPQSIDKIIKFSTLPKSTRFSNLCFLPHLNFLKDWYAWNGKFTPTPILPEVTMKEKLLVGFMCFFSFVTLSLAQQDSLSLNATFDQNEYQVGQPVKLTVTINNTSSEEVLVRLSSPDISVESGGEIIFKRKGTPGKKGEVKKLKPGESWANQLEYTPEFFNMPSAGTYEVTITYKNTQKKGSGKAYGKKHSAAKYDLWTGKVKTTTTLKIN